NKDMAFPSLASVAYRAGKVQKHIKRIKDKLELESGDNIISYSSIKNSKQQEIWNFIETYI
ncbi:hypothetical protein RCF44_07940, partial [Staphylococcus epidermidis]|nr:hypothetical protein [Staphylococcus epidermidis]